MNISSKTKQRIYSEIHDSITSFRIDYKLESGIDFAIAQLEREIWERVKAAIEHRPHEEI